MSVEVTRRERFSSGHRYWLDDLTEQQNRERFGEWASPYNHGHNYELFVSVVGTPHSVTGMVANISQLKSWLRANVLNEFDQKSINDEVEPFRRNPPTLENIIRYIWRRLSDSPEDLIPSRIRLHETAELSAEMTVNTLTITRAYHFCASHRLQCDDLSDQENRDLFGPCNNEHGHGHNYDLEVTVSGDVDEATGMMVDIHGLDHAVEKEILSRYDHRNLNVGFPEFQGKNPTSEVFVREIYERLDGAVPATLQKVVLKETPRNIFEYSGASK